MRPSASSNTRSARTLSARRSASSSASSAETPRRTSRPGPIDATCLPSTETDARPTRWTRARTPARGASAPRGEALAVDPVVAAIGAQVRGDREVAPRALGPAREVERAAEAEVGEVVDRVALDDGLELLRGLAEVAAAEVRAPQRLADRRLV